MNFEFHKYHALGNDYIVIDPREFSFEPTERAVRAVCDRMRGVGSDGILLGPLGTSPLRLRIFNPDGSEAEKSGNGLRIFSLYLHDAGYVGEREFQVETAGGRVTACIESVSPSKIRVDMGEPSFSTKAAGLGTEKPEFILETLDLGTETIQASFVSMGNPHCVIMVDEPTEELARRLGSLVENHPLFPARTNVQFLKVEDEHHIRIQIWERGAGYTLASGSSSCAAASVAKRLGLVEGEVLVSMPGGLLHLDLSRPSIRMTGPAAAICHGVFSETLKREFSRPGA
jgi:diaminopimelate epimerase